MSTRGVYVPPHVAESMLGRGLVRVRQLRPYNELFGARELVTWATPDGEASFAPAWQMLLSVADPMSEVCREWARDAAYADPAFRAELDAVARLVHGPGSYERFAELVVERWLAAYRLGGG